MKRSSFRRDLSRSSGWALLFAAFAGAAIVYALFSPAGDLTLAKAASPDLRSPLAAQTDAELAILHPRSAALDIEPDIGASDAAWTRSPLFAAESARFVTAASVQLAALQLPSNEAPAHAIAAPTASDVAEQEIATVLNDEEIQKALAHITPAEFARLEETLRFFRDHRMSAKADRALLRDQWIASKLASGEFLEIAPEKGRKRAKPELAPEGTRLVVWSVAAFQATRWIRVTEAESPVLFDLMDLEQDSSSFLRAKLKAIRSAETEARPPSKKAPQ